MSMRRVMVLSMAVVAAVMLIGCGAKGESGRAAPSDPMVEADDPGGGTGANGVNWLAIGTMQLEGSDDAVTQKQAAKLLPLWTAIQAGSLRGTAEQDAVLKQIRGEMTEAQLAAIDAMEMTPEGGQAWMGEQGLGAGPDEGQRPGGGQGPFGEMSEEERAEMREQFQSMTDDERATAMAERGIQRPEGGGRGGQGGAGGFGGGGGNPLLQPLIDLLTERAAE